MFVSSSGKKRAAEIGFAANINARIVNLVIARTCESGKQVSGALAHRKVSRREFCELFEIGQHQIQVLDQIRARVPEITSLGARLSLPENCSHITHFSWNTRESCQTRLALCVGDIKVMGSLLMQADRRNLLRNLLILLFTVAMVMGTGPGVLLVNRPTSVFGIPLLYAWGILWYFILVGIAVLASKYLWKPDDEAEETNPE